MLSIALPSFPSHPYTQHVILFKTFNSVLISQNYKDNHSFSQNRLYGVPVALVDLPAVVVLAVTAGRAEATYAVEAEFDLVLALVADACKWLALFGGLCGGAARAAARPRCIYSGSICGAVCPLQCSSNSPWAAFSLIISTSSASTPANFWSILSTCPASCSRERPTSA
eukprot:COSAG05_NODE_1003_length_6237_cov_7.337732_7_plen_169_part_00